MKTKPIALFLVLFYLNFGFCSFDYFKSDAATNPMVCSNFIKKTLSPNTRNSRTRSIAVRAQSNNSQNSQGNEDDGFWFPRPQFEKLVRKLRSAAESIGSSFGFAGQLDRAPIISQPDSIIEPDSPSRALTPYTPSNPFAIDEKSIINSEANPIIDVQANEPQRNEVVGYDPARREYRGTLMPYERPRIGLGGAVDNESKKSKMRAYDRQRVGLGVSLDNESVRKNLKSFQITEAPSITDELRLMKSTDSFTRILQFVKNPELLKVANASHENLLQFIKDEFNSYVLNGTNYYGQSKIFDDWLLTWEDILTDFRDFEKAAYDIQQRNKESFSDVNFLFDDSKLQQSLVRFNELSPESFKQFNQNTVAQYEYLAGFFDYILSKKRPNDYRQNVDLKVIFEETPNSSTSKYLATPKIETILKILTEYQKIVTQEQVEFQKEADDIFVTVGFVAFQGYKTLTAEQSDLIKQYVSMVKDLVKKPGNAVFEEKNLVRRLLKQSPLQLANDKQLRNAFERALIQNKTLNLRRVVNNQKLLNYVQKLSRVSRALSKYGELALKENQLAFINVPQFQELGDTVRISKVDLLTQIVHFYSPGHIGYTGLYQVLLDAQLGLILESFAQGHPEEKAIFQTIKTDKFADGFLHFCLDEPETDEAF